MDHSWPADLDEPGAACEWCGLEYNQWSTDDPGCPGPPEDVHIKHHPWLIEKASQIVVVAHADRGAEWEYSVAFGPFETTKEAEEFAAEHDRLGNMAPDFTVISEVSSLHKVVQREVRNE